MMKEIKALKCEYCSKLYQQERFAILHEKRCSKNPDNRRMCFGCEHLERVKTDHTVFDHNGNDYLEKVSILRCSKIGSFVYPPKVEHSEQGPYLPENLNDVENIPMKRECNFFEPTMY